MEAPTPRRGGRTSKRSENTPKHKKKTYSASKGPLRFLKPTMPSSRPREITCGVVRCTISSGLVSQELDLVACFGAKRATQALAKGVTVTYEPYPNSTDFCRGTMTESQATISSGRCVQNSTDSPRYTPPAELDAFAKQHNSSFGLTVRCLSPKMTLMVVEELGESAGLQNLKFDVVTNLETYAHLPSSRIAMEALSVDGSYVALSMIGKAAQELHVFDSFTSDISLGNKIIQGSADDHGFPLTFGSNDGEEDEDQVMTKEPSVIIPWAGLTMAKNTLEWLQELDIHDSDEIEFVDVSAVIREEDEPVFRTVPVEEEDDEEEGDAVVEDEAEEDDGDDDGEAAWSD